MKIHSEKPEFKNLVIKIEDIFKNQHRVVVAVSGFGGAGKTSLADEIEEHFKPDAVQVKLDNFLINHGEGEGWAGGYDWNRFEQVLKDVNDGKDLHYKFYDWHKDALSEGYIDQKLPRLIIIEGVRIFQPELMRYYDFSVWIDVDLDTATERGKTRDHQNWQDMNNQAGLNAHLATWHTTWTPKDKEFYEKFHPDKIADYVYNNQRPKHL